MVAFDNNECVKFISIFVRGLLAAYQMFSLSSEPLLFGSNAKGNTQPHNIDIHAVNGSGGGAAFTTVDSGQEKVFTFKAKVAGLFMYHCAVGNIVDHISNGMYGLVLVEPEGRLPSVSKNLLLFWTTAIFTMWMVILIAFFFILIKVRKQNKK